MNLTATTENGVAHILYDLRQTVCAYVGMCIGKNGRGGSMLTEHVENLLYIATFLRAGIEFTVGIGTCPTLAETIVTLRIHLLRPADVCQIALTLMNILSTLQNDRTKPKLNQSESGKQSTGACADDDDLRLATNVRILRMEILIISGWLVDVYAHFKIDEDSALAGIDTALQYTYGSQCPDIVTVLVG